MTEHLRQSEIVDALDAPLPAGRQAHLEACDACQAELAGLRGVLREARGVDLPEPSPLFWDHFTDRVRAAVAAEPAPAGSWWRAWWRPAVAAAMVGSVALVVALRPAGPSAPREAGPLPAPVSSLSFSGDDGSWGLVVGLASELDWSDVREAARPAEGTADAMIEELTPEQRRALARLLQEGMGDLQ